MADFRIHDMSDELRKKLRIRAAEEDTNLNELILRILEEAVSKPPKK
jgi:plasmid stability protein